MKLVIEDDADAAGRTVAAIVLGAMLQDRRVNVSLTAGATPVPVYRHLVAALRAHPETYENVRYYNFDEVPLSAGGPGLTMSALREQLYGPAGLADDALRILRVDNADEIRADLRDHGGLDLVLMGLGTDGHFCANMPGTTRFDADVYTFAIEPTAPWYDEVVAALPPGADTSAGVVTFGLPMILAARQAVLMVTGAGKAATLAAILREPVSTHLPATALRLHPNLVLVADRDAAKEIAP
ncbi:MAG TPA: 6-phosphogluconolactonase [Actinotalea sp.]|nr:6-phosphogluconolactonase [Actinotalea sp.]